MLYPEYDDIEDTSGALIKVVGVGGGGGNAVNHMVENMINQGGILMGETTLHSDENGKIVFYAVNTDAQALRKSKVQQTVQIGASTTKGLGAGANPNVGRKAAEDDQDEIRKMLEGADMVFIAAGMGGGTGTGAAPIVAKVARELGILTVAVVTKPFSFEGKKRMQFAELGIKALSEYVDSLIVIQNDKLLKVLGKNVTVLDAFAAANDILRNAVTGISDMITSPGMVNVDFADVKTVMSEMGRSMMGSSVVQGEMGDGRAEKAAQEAIASPLLEDVDLSGARGILVNVSGGFDIALAELDAIGNMVKALAAEDATVVVGAALLPDMSNEIRVTLVATGIGDIDHPTKAVEVPPTKAETPKPSMPEERIRPMPPTAGLNSLYTAKEPVKAENPYGDLDRPISDRLNNINIFNPNGSGRSEG